jgi:uncharacterized membrane protein YoaK (UPF0700 family)
MYTVAIQQIIVIVIIIIIIIIIVELVSEFKRRLTWRQCCALIFLDLGIKIQEQRWMFNSVPFLVRITTALAVCNQNNRDKSGRGLHTSQRT